MDDKNQFQFIVTKLKKNYPKKSINSHEGTTYIYDGDALYRVETLLDTPEGQPVQINYKNLLDTLQKFNYSESNIPTMVWIYINGSVLSIL